MKLKLLQKTLAVIIICTSIYSCKKDQSENNQTSEILVQKSTIAEAPIGDPIEEAKLNKLVIEQLEQTGDFKWENQELKMLWSGLQYNNHSLAIGYAPADVSDISTTIHSVNVKAGKYLQVHDALINFILNELNKYSATPIELSDILLEDDPILPILTVRLTDKNVLTALYNLKNVRYLEPLDFWPGQSNRSSSGCTNSPYALNPLDWTTVAPNARVPWNFNNVTIPSAWTLSQGAGVTISVIDAGLSSSQSLLGSQFRDGLSAGARTFQVAYTYGNTAYTSCTHGTSMSGLAAGPRNNQNTTTGVAYQSNLYFVRACDDVVLDGSAERTGVKNALTLLGNNSSIKIISMSIGTPFSSSVLKDGVDFANGKGKLVLAAAGTSFGWTSWWGVIYPAAYASCVAITGVNESSNTCSDCHDGSQVQFTIPMERNGNTNRTSLSLGSATNSSTYIGGSSCATATAAGIAALVWSAKPSMTKDQVVACLRNTSQNFPTKNNRKGYGNLNATAAINYALVNY
jgi:serine protease